jgi:WD40 repeat protein
VLTGNGPVLQVAFSPDGHTLALLSADDTARLWNFAERANPYELDPLTDHTVHMRSIGFGPDGRTLAMVSDDDTAMLWDVADQAEPIRLATIRLDDSRAPGAMPTTRAVLFSPDGHTVAFGADRSASGATVTLWDYAELNDVRADPSRYACAAAGGGLSPAEWPRYVPELPYRSTCVR